MICSAHTEHALTGRQAKACVIFTHVTLPGGCQSPVLFLSLTMSFKMLARVQAEQFDVIHPLESIFSVWLLAILACSAVFIHYSPIL